MRLYVHSLCSINTKYGLIKVSGLYLHLNWNGVDQSIPQSSGLASRICGFCENDKDKVMYLYANKAIRWKKIVKMRQSLFVLFTLVIVAMHRFVVRLILLRNKTFPLNEFKWDFEKVTDPKRGTECFSPHWPFRAFRDALVHVSPYDYALLSNLCSDREALAH